MLAIAGLGGLLGVLFSVPAAALDDRRGRCRSPEGKAAAEVLKAGERTPSRHLKDPGLSPPPLGGLIQAAAASGMKLIPGHRRGRRLLRQVPGYMGTNLSPALLGVGYIVGPQHRHRGGLRFDPVLAHRVPLYHMFFLDSDPALAAKHRRRGAPRTSPGAIWSAKIRYLGVGAMLIGGVDAVLAAQFALSGVAAASRGPRGIRRERRRDRARPADG